MTPRPSNIRWVIVALLFMVTTNNYLDRIMLTTLSTVLMENLKFGEKEYGYISAAFNLTYAVGFLMMGKLIDRQGTRIGYAISIVFWSVAAGLHALSRNFVDLSIWRALLGFGESGNFPAGIKAVAEWFPRRDRAFAISVFNSGTNVTSIIGPPMFYWMNLHFGWRACFLITSSTGLICLVIWWWLFRTPREHPWVNEAELAIIESDQDEKQEATVTWMQALRIRETYGYAIAKFLSDPVWWFYLQWLVPFFKRERNLDLKNIVWALPVIYIAASAGSLFGGWLSGFLIRRGWSSLRSRRAAMTVFACCMPLAATGISTNYLPLTVALFGLATAAHQGWSCNLYATVPDSFPKNVVASVTSIGGFLGGIGGVIFASLVPGFIVPTLGYTPVFVVMGSLHLIALATFFLFMGRGKAATAAPAPAA